MLNLEQSSAVLESYLAADIPAFMWGAPGIGKSDSVHAIAARPQSWADHIFKTLGLPYAGQIPIIDVRAILLDPVDLRGLPAVVDGRAIWAQPDFLPRADHHGPVGILFLDELNAAPASVQAACFQLILNRKLGDYTMPPGWRIVAAGNRQSDRAAAQRMPSALANRFAHLTVGADLDAWVSWAVRNNVHPMVIAFLRFRQTLLHLMPGAKPEDECIAAIPADAVAFPTPRAWAQVGKVADAPNHIRPQLVGGLVGEGPAAEFEGFARVWANLPSIADIIANPDKVQIPGDPATCYAVAGALARKADRKNLEPILRFAGRALGPEFSISLMMDATKRDSRLKETAAYIKFADANQGAFA